MSKDGSMPFTITMLQLLETWQVEGSMPPFPNCRHQDLCSHNLSMPKDAVLMLFVCLLWSHSTYLPSTGITNSSLGLHNTPTAIVTSSRSLGARYVHSNLRLKLAAPLLPDTEPSLLPRITMLCSSSRIVYLCGDSLTVSPICSPGWAGLQL